MADRDKCLDDECQQCSINGRCPLQNVAQKLHNYDQKGELASSVDDFSSVDSVVKALLSQYDQRYSIWNSINAWQIEPTNDSVSGFAWRLRALLFLNKIEFPGKNESIIREAFEIIASKMYEAIHEKCSGDVCRNCILSSCCPLESKIKK